MHRIVVLAVVGVLMAVAASHMLRTASHAVRAAHTAAHVLRCDATTLNRYDAADPSDGDDPTAPCAGIAKRLQAETEAGEAAVAPAPPGQ
ncbi:MAG TPA: hypothetical protein VGF68_03240 [Solirubrobacteraceae bacterium]